MSENQSIEFPSTLVIIPTYNEKDNLPRLVEAIHEVVPHVHILVVDDGSPDGTGELADAMAESDERIQVMHRTGKLGLGTAYIAGFKLALEQGYELIQQMDCDFSHRPEALPRFYTAIKDADLVLGSRWVDGGGTKNWPISRQFISRGGSFYARTILGVGLRDLTGGFKCFRREVLEAIDLDAVQAAGYSFQIEMTWRALQKGFQVLEIPILFVEREVGVSKMNKGIVLEAIGMVWKLRLSKAP